jgi:hypothetical protein
MFVGGGSVWNAKAGWPTAALDPTTVQVAPPAHHQSRTHCLCLKLVAERLLPALRALAPSE